MTLSNHMTFLRQAAGPGITALVGVGLQLADVRLHWLGYVLIAAAFAWAFALIVHAAWGRVGKRSEPTDDIRRLIAQELVSAIDDWRIVRGDGFTGTSYQAYSVLNRKTSEFVRDVFGETERQRFESNEGEQSKTLERDAELRIRALERLRDRPEDWDLRADREAIEYAIRNRRSYGQGDRIVVADWSPRERLAGFAESEGEHGDLSVDLGRPRVLVPKEGSDTTDWLVLVGGVRITNRSLRHNASLDFTFVADARIGAKGSHLRLEALRKDGSEGALTPPLELTPESTKTGQIAFRLPELFAQDLGEDSEHWLLRSGERGANSRMEIQDFISNTTITVPVPGSYPRTNFRGRG
jgi:hypothetical protein